MPSNCRQNMCSTFCSFHQFFTLICSRAFSFNIQERDFWREKPASPLWLRFVLRWAGNSPALLGKDGASPPLHVGEELPIINMIQPNSLLCFWDIWFKLLSFDLGFSDQQDILQYGLCFSLALKTVKHKVVSFFKL